MCLCVCVWKSVNIYMCVREYTLHLAHYVLAIIHALIKLPGYFVYISESRVSLIT